MCFALFIAAASFLSIRGRVARVLPEPFPTGRMRALPLLLLLGAMLYWLWRVRGRGGPSRVVGHDSMPHTTTALLTDGGGAGVLGPQKNALQPASIDVESGHAVCGQVVTRVAE